MPTGLPAPPLPPLPAPGAPMPAPQPSPIPPPTVQPLPTPIPLPTQDASVPLPTPVNDPNTTLSGKAQEQGYNDLWAKRSSKPLQQIYGHIDRISNKEAGSLLDRYADRFGHALDREIIVMRKAAVEEKVAEIREAPTVELLNEEDEEPLDELQQVENELRALKPLYQEAKSLGDKETLAELTPTLQALMTRRKALKGGSSVQEPVTAEPTTEDDNDALYSQFVGIVDDLLGNHLPEAIVSEFMASENFDTYRLVVGSMQNDDVANLDEETREFFYRMVDDQLGNMSDEAIADFMGTPDFGVYEAIGEQYKAE